MMKKYTLILFVFAFVLLGFSLKTPTVIAYDSGCIGSNTYSITTGLPCYGSQYNYNNTFIAGCTSNYGFSSTTGQSCATQINYQNNNYIPGCIAGNAFSVTTGQPCFGSQVGYQNNVYIPGCTGAGPYSITTGQPCYGSQGNSSNTFLNQQFQIGQTGPDVLALQQMLASAGLYFGQVDGFYGPITDAAFRSYQQRYPNYNTNCIYPYTNNCSTPLPGVYNQPVISGVSGPQSLAVNQMGTWSVNAYNQYNQNSGVLSYSVNWGDQNAYPYSYGSNSAQSYLQQQNATFTHSYLQAGTYTAIFTVTSSTGQTAQTSLTVSVNGSSYYGGVPTISYLTPTVGAVGTQVTIYGTGFNLGLACATQYGGCNTGNTINFGGNIIQALYLTNGTSLTFSVPSILSGTYPVYVNNMNGTSNSVSFTVTNGFQPQSNTTVSIQNFAFNPATLNIQRGTQVTWINNDNVSHTVTSDLGTFDSGTLSPGQSFSFTFFNPGFFNYHCNIHPMMRGSIVVN